MKRRVYYDHESVYQSIAARGGVGWDDATDTPPGDSYDGLLRFRREYERRIRGAKVLDLGCGGGQAGLVVAELAQEILGLDYSETAIRLARRNTHQHPHIRCRVADCVAPDVPSGGFDLVLDNHTLHCLVREQDRVSFLSHAHRALADGGLLFSETMSSEGGFQPAAFEVAAEGINGRSTRIWVSQERLNEELGRGGFHVLQQHRTPQTEQPNPGDLLWTVAERI